MHASSTSLKPSAKPGMSTTNTSLTCGAWKVIFSPNVGWRNNTLDDVTADTNDVWAVGYHLGSKNTNDTLTEHWNGTRWSVVPSPNVGSSSNVLVGVARVPGSTLIWAVGYTQDIHGKASTLTEQWDGTSWNVIPSPNVGLGDAVLQKVTAISASDIWAVGYYTPSINTQQALIEHWDGTSWNIVPAPNIGSGSNALVGITQVPGTTQVWAVGYYTTNTNTEQALVEQWDGTSWNVLPTPNITSILHGVTAISASNIWAVGNTTNGTLTEQWNGTSWNIVPSPSVGSFNAVIAISANNIWAVGYYSISGNGSRTLTEQWNGTNWNIVPSPSPGSTINDLLGASWIPGTSQVWSVGLYTINTGQTLSEFYC